MKTKVALIILNVLLAILAGKFYFEKKTFEDLIFSESEYYIKGEEVSVRKYYEMYRGLDSKNWMTLKKNLGVHVAKHIRYEGDIEDIESFDREIESYFSK